MACQGQCNQARMRLCSFLSVCTVKSSSRISQFSKGRSDLDDSVEVMNRSELKMLMMNRTRRVHWWNVTEYIYSSIILKYNFYILVLYLSFSHFVPLHTSNPLQFI